MTSLVTRMFEDITNGDDVTKVVPKKCEKIFFDKFTKNYLVDREGAGTYQ